MTKLENVAANSWASQSVTMPLWLKNGADGGYPPRIFVNAHTASHVIFGVATNTDQGNPWNHAYGVGAYNPHTAAQNLYVDTLIIGI